jgi:vacuolar-type H+-ATPase subunit E/Vma4
VAPVPAPVPASASAPAWDAGSVELAGWILSEANAHAAEIRHEARDEAAASLADAKKEAADLLRQASDRAAAKLAAVESEAAQVQAALMKLSTELGEAAATALHPAAD